MHFPSQFKIPTITIIFHSVALLSFNDKIIKRHKTVSLD
jgi:hypothetical protein